jgi:hypothetical protein
MDWTLCACKRFILSSSKSRLSLKPVQPPVPQAPEIDGVVPCVVAHPHGSVPLDGVLDISKELVGGMLILVQGWGEEAWPQDVVPEG